MIPIAELWDVLGTEGPNTSGHVARRLPMIVACEVFLAVQRPGNLRALLVEVESGAIPPRLRLPEAEGFGVELMPLTAGPGGMSRIVLHARDEDRYYLFGALVEDIVRHLAQALDASSALRILTQRLQRWQHFFAAGGAEGLSPKRQQGLWAELWFMREHLLRPEMMREVVASWRGPVAGNHDFEFENLSVEVKSSLAGPPVDIRITNVLQLQQSAGKDLILLVLLMDDTGGESVAEMVTAVRAKVADNAEAQVLFEDRLLEAGYADVLRDHYPILRFTMREQHAFGVGDGFPRIIEKDLRPGVGDVRYGIALGACEPFKVAAPTLEDLFPDWSDAC